MKSEKKRLLSPGKLAKDFGPRSVLYKQCVARLYDVLRGDEAALDDWRLHFGNVCGTALERSADVLHDLAAKLEIAVEIDFGADVFLFAMQSYYARLLTLLVRRFPILEEIEFGVEPFSRRLWEDDDSLAVESKSLSAAMDEYLPQLDEENSTSGDLLKALYQELFPRRLRHVLGEYYTPDWLADHLLNQLGYRGQTAGRLLDPACGSGTFLLSAIKRIRADWGNDKSRSRELEYVFSNVVGIDLNPLAVMTARANYLIAVHDLILPGEQFEIPVYLGDSILGGFAQNGNGLEAESFDVIAGNPPWIAWDNLPDDYRQATKPLWERYGLFSLSGNEARHGGAKKDLSMLMLYATADRYLKNGGRLGFIITQTIFQTKGAGDGFRRFRLGNEGPDLQVVRVDDFTAVRPFREAANWTSGIVVQKGAATQYPVPYFKWQTGDGTDGAKKIILTPFSARPVSAEKPGSPWMLLPEGVSAKPEHIIGPSDYEAHLGANTGGANGVYWLELLGPADNGCVRVRNLPEKGKTAGEVVEAVIERDLIYPLLRWGDVGRYAIKPHFFILLAQDCAKRSGIDENLMRKKYPRTLEYLNAFERQLCGRAAYKRYQSGRPFYSMYNVGPYTAASIKVVWRRMDRRINAAVAASMDDSILGRRCVVPQETCSMVECDCLDEAHYLCAMLNCEMVNNLVQAHSVSGGKGFGTPSMLEYLNIRRYEPENELHKKLAESSKAAHAS